MVEFHNRKKHTNSQIFFVKIILVNTHLKMFIIILNGKGRGMLVVYIFDKVNPK